ncbi:MAG: hypothetical protein Kow002_00730 [Anaerolineales bacterium]
MSALRFVFFASLFLLSACTMDAVTETPPPPTAEPVIIVVTATPQPELTPSPTATEAAPPLCAVDNPAACELPEADIRDKFCVRKVPYVLMTFPQGTTFDVSDARFTCTDEGIRGGEQMVSCYGPELFSFDLKVCNAACTPNGAVLERGACEDGYGYDSSNECCLRLPTTDSNCHLVRVELGACPGA